MILDAVFTQKLAEFFLKGAAAMVLLLCLHIFNEAASWLGLTENAP
jgi:hypothetical protein